MSPILTNKAQIAQIAVRTLGGPLANTVAAALNAYQTAQGLQQLQGMLGQLQTALGKLNGMLGGGAGQAAGAQPGCASPGSISVTVLANPARFLAGGGELQKHAKAPIVGNDSQWPAFADAANNRCSGHRPLFNGSNPWSKQGAARDEAALVGWATQQNDTVQYDTDRKMFYQADKAGNRTDVMSLDDLKKVADGAGGISQNNGAAFQAVGKAIGEASKAAEAPSLGKLLDTFRAILEKLQKAGGPAGASAGSGVGAASAQFAPADGGSGTGGASSTDFSSGAEGGWSKIDSMMEQAERLANSEKPSDQLKAQQLMQKAQRMFEMISKMMAQRSEMMSKAIQAIK